jgi:hypothetical protein
VAAEQSLERALQVTQSVAEGEIGSIEAAHALLPILFLNPGLASEEDFNFIRGVESETDHLPTGRLRAEWHPDYLPEKDREVASCDAIWGNQIREVCGRIRRSLLLRKLVVARHVNVAERRVLGNVGREEVANVLRSILLKDSVFPLAGREGVIYEGAILGLNSSGAQITLSRARVDNPGIMAQRRVDKYRDVDEAIEAFIDLEWASGIDGIAITLRR